MPLYNYICTKCGKPDRRILTVEQSKNDQVCKHCPYSLVRVPVPPSSRAVETLDNGIMTKSIERLADAERLFRERREAVDKEEKGEDGQS